MVSICAKKTKQKNRFRNNDEREKIFGHLADQGRDFFVNWPREKKEEQKFKPFKLARTPKEWSCQWGKGRTREGLTRGGCSCGQVSLLQNPCYFLTSTLESNVVIQNSTWKPLFIAHSDRNQGNSKMQQHITQKPLLFCNFVYLSFLKILLYTCLFLKKSSSSWQVSK